MTSKSALVREALPDLINLLDIFQKVVTGEIENYNETGASNYLTQLLIM